MQKSSSYIDKIADVVLKIQKDAKIGSAYERYDTLYLWDLGQLIVQYEKSSRNIGDPTGDILEALSNQAIKCQPVLLKNAETTTRIWLGRDEYQRVARGISYGKLKAVLPLIDPDFVSADRIPSEEIKGLLDVLRHATYEDVLLRVRELRTKYDPRGQALDLDDFYQELYTATEDLRQIVEGKQMEELKEFRLKFSSRANENSRRLIAAMKSEEAFERLSRDISKNSVYPQESSVGDLMGHLNSVLSGLLRIKAVPSARQRLRDRIGILRLGELSTLMKAASSDEELESYLRGQQLLEQIRKSGIGGATS